jgi:hypothetical protein
MTIFEKTYWVYILASRRNGTLYVGVTEAKNGAAREIALAFGVPPLLLRLPGDNTHANYAEANRAFYRADRDPAGAAHRGGLRGVAGRGGAAPRTRPRRRRGARR